MIDRFPSQTLTRWAWRYRLISIVSLLGLVLVTLACGGGGGATEEKPAAPPADQSAETPAAPEPTSVPAGHYEYDTAFPLPDDVQNLTGGGGEEMVNFQTGLSINKVIEFYRQALAEQDLTEYELLTTIEDEAFSVVFTGWPDGRELVIQGVDLGGSTSVNIRLEEVVD
jgi:hypothetical protein